MNLVVTNLSHYWRRPMLMFWQIVLVLMYLPSLIMMHEKRPDKWTGPLFWPLFWMLVVGTITSAYQMEILSKPFSFSLPQHRVIFRKLLFSFNFFWSLFCSVMVLVFYRSDMVHRCNAAVLVLSAGSLMFWFGVWCSYKSQNQAIIGFMVPLLILAPQLMDRLSLGQYWLEPPMIILMAIVAGAASMRAWRMLGQESLFQSCCGKSYIGFMGDFSARGIRKIQRQQLAAMSLGADDSISGFERFFVGGMIRNRCRAFVLSLYGGLYLQFGPGLIRTLRSRGVVLLMMLLVFLLFGYYGEMGNMLIWIMAIVPMVGSDYMLCSTLMLRRGRLERFASAFALLGVMMVIFMVYIALGVMLTHLAAPYMPSISIKGFQPVFHALNFQWWYLYAAVMPLLLVVRLMFWGRRIFLAAFAAVMGGIAGVSFSAAAYAKHIHQTDWYVIVLIILGGWAIFTVYLYRLCFYRDLAAK